MAKKTGVPFDPDGRVCHLPVSPNEMTSPVTSPVQSPPLKLRLYGGIYMCIVIIVIIIIIIIIIITVPDKIYVCGHCAHYTRAQKLWKYIDSWLSGNTLLYLNTTQEATKLRTVHSQATLTYYIQLCMLHEYTQLIVCKYAG